jgi:glucosamine--fructose-6-phosphate aminotransferase (isomerizing)
MCGIIGFVGKRPAVGILVEGLRRLEYRGYDSAGIALVDQQKLTVTKAAGRLSVAEQLIDFDTTQTTGIGHTRWATHGAPNDVNAHPHCDSTGKFAIIHNGIIENYKELTEQLVAQGYQFSSETDTEVVAHLIDSFYQGDLHAAVAKATEKLDGAYALAIIALDQPDMLVACRKGSPLVLGVGFEENFVASDVSALLPVTSRFIYLQEGDFAVLNGKGYQVYDALGQPKEL